jgi:hypothetical protein
MLLTVISTIKNNNPISDIRTEPVYICFIKRENINEYCHSLLILKRLLLVECSP